jgi:hypothetical protein
MVMMPPCTWLSRTWFWPACTLIKGQGPHVRKEIRVLFSLIIPCRAVAQETLDGDPIRFFILKVIFRFLVDLCGVRDQATTAWMRRLEFLKFPSSDRVLQKHRWMNVAIARIASIPDFCKPRTLFCIATFPIGSLIRFWAYYCCI